MEWNEKDISKRNLVNVKLFDAFIQSTDYFDRFTELALAKRVIPNEKDLEAYKEQDWRDNLIGFMKVHGYITVESEIKKVYLLTERGNLAKELGGHKNFQKHRKAEIELLKYQRRVNGLLIAATILAGSIPLAIFIADKIWFSSGKSEPEHRIEIHVDSAVLNKSTTQSSK